MDGSASDLVMWNLIIGFLSPLLVSVINRPSFSDGTRACVMALVSILGGAGTAWFSGMFDTQDVVRSILIVAVASITFYKGWWRPTAVTTKIENATSPGTPEGS